MRLHTRLDEDDIAHLRHLLSSWSIMADLGFADLLLLTPVHEDEGSKFVVLGQVRPTTSQAFYRDDLVGRMVDEYERPLLARAWRRNEIVESDDVIMARTERARVQCIPVVRDGRPIAIISRDAPLTSGRRPWELERSYLEAFGRLAVMTQRGEFPYSFGATDFLRTRVSDGTVLLDAHRRVLFVSPNVINLFHRFGFQGEPVGKRLEEIGIASSVARSAFSTHAPVFAELEPCLGVAAYAVCLPFVDNGNTTGGLVVLRDISDVRRREHVDASSTISMRDAYRFMRTNLHAVMTMLELQCEQRDDPVICAALNETYRRVEHIALTYEVLSLDTGEKTSFEEILLAVTQSITQHASEGGTPLRICTVGELGAVDPNVSTPLIVALSDILMAAIGRCDAVSVSLSSEGAQATLSVSDDAEKATEDAIAAEFDIARAIVKTHLNGIMECDPANHPLLARITVPLPRGIA